MSELVRRLRERVAPDFGPENVAHDLSHLDRVWQNCRRIAAEEGGDLEVLAAAAYLHDLHRALERDSRMIVRPQATGGLVREILVELDFPAAKLDAVVACVEASGSHSFAKEPHNVLGREPMILKDADNLDAMGAIGVARALMFGAHLQEPLFGADADYAGHYVPGRTRSIVHHFHEKLLKLRDDMHTRTGRRLARERHVYMVAFLEQLGAEAQPLPGASVADHAIAADVTTGS